MPAKLTVIKEIAAEYREAQLKIGGKLPPCFDCSDIQIYICTQIETKVLQDSAKGPGVEPCLKFEAYVSQRGVGITGRINRRAGESEGLKPEGEHKRKPVIL